jgi:hypothetical protein
VEAATSGPDADTTGPVVLAPKTTAAAPEPFAAHATAIADLARQLGGAGATAELATRTGASLLDQDPVSAAESMDPALPRSRHTSAPSDPA